MILHDALIFTPDDVDLARSPLAGRIDAETYVLGAFNPGLTRLPSGNLLLMVRVAEALKHPVRDQHIHAIRWEAGRYRLDPWPIGQVDPSDPRKFTMRQAGWRVMALTSLSWLLPVELSPDGRRVEAVHYAHALAPGAPYECYGIEDARISRIGNLWYMTVCAVSPERHCTVLYTSDDALHWQRQGIVLDHQNKDMLLFEGLIEGRFWAQTRPLGDLYFAYPPDSTWRAGPAINLASSPDALHWKPCDHPGLRPHAATLHTARMGGGAPPVLTDQGWLSLWHGVEPAGVAGIYRTYWSLLDAAEPWRVLRTEHDPLITPNPALTEPLKDRMYLENIVFTTGIVDAGDHYLVASGEADLACRMTWIDKRAFG
ncbi:MAG: glycosidase [Sphingomonas sp.]|uniref:glycoside hydrolase family 130 protein n=1 Tax=Sphingomonas sp. TaxID=28214 RepID=UPI0025ED3AFE|nr:glycosidase [Sphingomonas sp.]MBX9882007.1 glycosidase [Sphingomonas sp.]